MLFVKIQCVNSQYVCNHHIITTAMLQEDCEMLKHPRLTPCSRLAIQLRVTEKKLLEAAEQYVKQRIKIWRDE